MKIGVHFNCQNDGIAAALRALLPGADIVNFHSATDLPVGVQQDRAGDPERVRSCHHQPP